MDHFHLDIVIGGDAHRGLNAVERVLDLGFVLAAADQEADGRVLGRGLDEIIDGIDIEVQFPGEFGLERDGLEFDDDVAVEGDVEEEHVQSPGLAGNDDLLLSTQVGKAGT